MCAGHGGDHDGRQENNIVKQVTYLYRKLFQLLFEQPTIKCVYINNSLATEQLKKQAGSKIEHPSNCPVEIKQEWLMDTVTLHDTENILQATAL